MLLRTWGWDIIIGKKSRRLSAPQRAAHLQPLLALQRLVCKDVAPVHVIAAEQHLGCNRMRGRAAVRRMTNERRLAAAGRRQRRRRRQAATCIVAGWRGPIQCDVGSLVRPPAAASRASLAPRSFGQLLQAPPGAANSFDRCADCNCALIGFRCTAPDARQRGPPPAGPRDAPARLQPGLRPASPPPSTLQNPS